MAGLNTAIKKRKNWTITQKNIHFSGQQLTWFMWLKWIICVIMLFSMFQSPVCNLRYPSLEWSGHRSKYKWNFLFDHTHTGASVDAHVHLAKKKMILYVIKLGLNSESQCFYRKQYKLLEWKISLKKVFTVGYYWLLTYWTGTQRI